MKNAISQHTQKLMLLSIMLVAIVLRFQYLLQIEHNVDHAYPVWQALRTLDAGEFPVIGQGTSVLFANPALTGYLFAPLMTVPRSIISVYVFVITLNTLGVYLTYRAVTSLLGARLALVAAGLMAVNPWIIEYSRYSWPPALLVFFTSAVAWLLFPILLGMKKTSDRRMFATLVTLAIMSQTSMLAYFVVAVVGLLLLIFRKRIPRRGFLIGAMIFLAVQVVYVGGLLADWDTVQAEITEFNQDSSESEFKLDALQHGLRLVTGHQYEVARGSDAPIQDDALRQQLSAISSATLTLLIAGGAVVTVLAVVRSDYCNYPPEITADHAREAGIITLLWFGIPILAMSFNASFVHPYYQLVGLPAGFVLAAWGIGYVFSPYTPTRIWVVILLMIPHMILMGINSARFYQETQATPGRHDLGALPVEWGLRLGQAINKHLPEGGVVFADVDEWTLNSFSARLYPLIRDTRAPAVTIVPASGGLYIVAHPPETNHAFIPPFAKRVETLALPDGWTITLDLFQPGAVELDSTLDQVNIPSERWLALEAYTMAETDEGLTLTSYWRVSEITPDLAIYNFAPFVHVFNDEGERVAIIDGKGIPGHRWYTDDLHIHQMQVDISEDIRASYSLAIGQFDGVQNESLIFILPDGEYTATIPIIP